MSTDRPPRSDKELWQSLAVSRDVAPYTIVGGVPARPIRKRFDDSVAAGLRRIAWWDWPDALIFERLADFRSEAIEEFCRRYDPAANA